EDPVIAFVQKGYDKGDTNNAYFVPQADGLPGYMSLYLFEDTGSAPLGRYADTAFDSDVVLHELTHGASCRLVGGPAGKAQCLQPGMAQSGALGEGYSDWFPASIYDSPVSGEYTTGDPEKGIRAEALDTGELTFGDLCNVGSRGCESHDDGQIWAQTLWSVREALIEKAGFPDGRDMAEQLAVDGMKLSPCAPGFLDMRDAIILADEHDYDGADHCTLWEAFATRGMGISAASDPADQAQVTEAFDLPEQCLGSGRISFDSEAYGCDDSGYLILIDTNALPPVSVTVTSSGGDSETFELVVADGGAIRSSEITIIDASGNGGAQPGNGVLEVEEGDTLTAEYLDADPLGRIAAAEAIIRCTADVRVLSHRIVNGTCPSDGDAIDGFPDLPGYLDAGEKAELMIEIASMDASTLEETTLSVTSDNPNVIVSPSGDILIGTLRGMTGLSPQPAVLTFKVAAADSVTAGDSVTFTLDLTARGYHGTAAPVTLNLALHQDYALITGEAFVEDFEGSTAALWEHGVSAPDKSTNDEWILVTCDQNSPTTSYHNGGPDCSDYTDDQGDPILTSPVIDLFPPGTEAARINSLSFSHNVDLGGILFGNQPYEGEMVQVGFGDADLNQGAFSPLDVFVHIPEAGVDNNTGGAWEEKSYTLEPTYTQDLDLQGGVRVAWIFAIDFFGNHPDSDVVGNGYYLDDVSVIYDRVVATAQGSVCPGDCNVLAWAEADKSEVCAGETVTLDASQSTSLGCRGDLEYRWTDGLGWDTGFNSANVAVTSLPLDQSRTFTVEVRCPGMPSEYTDTMQVLVGVSGEDIDPAPGIGNNLRVIKAGPGAIRLGWSGAVTSPEYFSVFQTNRKEDLEETQAAIGSQLEIPVDNTKALKIINPQAMFYRIYPRNPCTSKAIIP
ncbi:M36 family metallopeptidase, partial [Acidobacteriota bacterium]